MRIGKQTIKLKNTPKIYEAACIVGPKEAQGPMSNYFDTKIDDVYYGEKSFEKAESKLLKDTINLLLQKSATDIDKVDYIFAGDLLNQCIASGYCMRDFDAGFFGLYGACSTFTESMILASLLVDGSYASKTVAAASSHFCTAERQYRLPLEHGNQKPPTAQTTVTGAGAALIINKDFSRNCPVITHVTPGKIIDAGLKDISNMGAAMAPAAIDTIITHLEDTGRNENYYDAIITGDLAIVGSQILIEQCKNFGIDISRKHMDCGVMMYDPEMQDTNAGGSGCGCSASIFSGYFFEQLKQKKLNKILILSTGALMSPTSMMQGESIPAIAHAVAIENILEG